MVLYSGQGLFPTSFNIHLLQLSSEFIITQFLPWSNLPPNREDKVGEKQVTTQSSTPNYIPREALTLSICGWKTACLGATGMGSLGDGDHSDDQEKNQ